MKLFFTSIGVNNETDHKNSVFLSKSCFPDWMLKSESEKENLNNKIPNYHWDDEEKLDSDYQFIKTVYKQTLLLICEKLNFIHGTNQETRYWEILIGPWLRVFISIIYDRYCQIKSVKTYKINSFIWIPGIEDLARTNDTLDFMKYKLNSTYWNHLIFQEIALIIHKDWLKDKFNNHQYLVKNTGESSGNKFKLFMKNLLEKINSNLCKKNRISINYSSLGKLDIIRLSIKLNIFPCLFDPHPRIQNKFKTLNHELRNSLHINYKLEDSQFSSILTKLIPIHFPLIFLENYKIARKASLNIYPNSPIKIITFEGYEYCDLYKHWIAEKTTSHSTYCIAQHGGNFGLAKHNPAEEFQLKTSDIFYSWGWKSKNKKIKILSSPKLSKALKVESNPKGIILLQINEWPRFMYRLSSIPHGPQQLDYFDKIINFIDRSPKSIKEKIRIKMIKYENGFKLDKFINNCSMGNIILDYKMKYLKALSISRLSIITTNSTCLLESLSSNVPTVIVLLNKYFKLRSSSLEQIENLRRNKILFNDFDSAREHINDIYKEIDKWWGLESVQNARLDFLLNYGYSNNNCFSNWKNEINQTLNN